MRKLGPSWAGDDTRAIPGGGCDKMCPFSTRRALCQDDGPCPTRSHDLVAEPGRIKLEWLVKLHWIAILGESTAIVGVQAAGLMQLPLAPLGALVGLRRGREPRAPGLAAARPGGLRTGFLAGVMLLDTAVLTGLLHLSGRPLQPLLDALHRERGAGGGAAPPALVVDPGRLQRPGLRRPLPHAAVGSLRRAGARGHDGRAPLRDARGGGHRRLRHRAHRAAGDAARWPGATRSWPASDASPSSAPSWPRW